mgnify:CR=1 FL=1
MNLPPDEPADISYGHRIYARTFGGVCLTGVDFERKCVAEKVRYDFLQGAPDPCFAGKIILLFPKASDWLKIGDIAPKKFWKEAVEVMAEVDRMDEMLDILRYRPESVSPEHYKEMDAEVYSIGRRFQNFMAVIL